MSDTENENATHGGGTAHSYCHHCDWFATPDSHEYADVMTAAEAHTTFEDGHRATVGVSEETVRKAKERKESATHE